VNKNILASLNNNRGFTTGELTSEGGSTTQSLTAKMRTRLISLLKLLI
jgi:hypothetical protein